MAFDNITDLPGYETPIDLRTLRGPILGGFSQRMSVPGNLTNYNFLPTPQSSNGISTGSTFGNSFPLMPPFNLGMPLATLFNFNIDGGGGGGGDTVTITGDGTYIGVTGTHPNFGLTFDETQICNYVEANCPGSFSDPYYKFMEDQQGTTTAASIQGDTFTIIGDWVDNSGGGNDIGFIQTDLNGSGDLQILYKRRMWESFYDGSAGRAYPTTSAEEFTIIGGTDIQTSISGTTCTINFTGTIPPDQNLFSTIAADNGADIEADSTTDTLTFAYDTDGGDYDNAIVITADPATDTVKFKLDTDVLYSKVPTTCMVQISAFVDISSPPGFTSAGSPQGWKFTGLAYTTSYDAGEDEVNVTTQVVDIWDMGYNEGTHWVSSGNDLFEDSPAPATVTEAIKPVVGQWVLATRLRPEASGGIPRAAYITATQPRLKTQCATP